MCVGDAVVTLLTLESIDLSATDSVVLNPHLSKTYSASATVKVDETA